MQRNYCEGSTKPPAPGTERGRSYRTGECEVCGERFSLYMGSGTVYQHREQPATKPARRDRVNTGKAAK